MAAHGGIGLVDKYRTPPQKRQDFLDGPEDVGHVSPLTRGVGYGAIGALIGTGFAVYLSGRKGRGGAVWAQRYPGSIARFRRNQTAFLSAVGFVSCGTVGFTSGIAAKVRRRDDRHNVKLGIMLSWLPTALMLQSASSALMLGSGAYLLVMTAGLARGGRGPLPNNFDVNTPEELNGPSYEPFKVIARYFFDEFQIDERKESMEEHYEKYKSMYPKGGM